jgi:3-phenylpropionate/trans-cinnamate dioxygenase ferredoxin subunit
MAEWVAACRANEVDPEDVIRWRHGDAEYAIYRSEHDDYFATAGHCTHEAELLCDGLVLGSIIECPKHNGRFDYRTGKARGAPAIIDLPTYPVRVENGVVFVEVP